MVDKGSNQEIESEKTKKKMRFGDGDGDGGGINSLPDAVLHQVLSFVRMKQAVQTSLVSKRWRYLWTSLPTLNFTRGKGFMEFVDAALLLRDSSSNIQRFNFSDLSYHSHSDSFSFDVDNDDSPESDSDYGSNSDDSSESDSDSDDLFSGKVPNFRLNVWILTAIRRNVEEIHLEIHFDKLVELPHCLFTCESLKKLELISLDTKPHKFSLPDSISLPRLRTLHLDRLALHHEDDSKINLFLSSCCGLESLTLKECGFHHKNLNIVAPSLEDFVIHDNSRTKQYLKHGGATGSISLYAPKLKSFHCKDYLSKSYCLENLSSLVEAYIDLKVGSKAKRKAGIWMNGRNVMIHGANMDLRELQFVKHLKLSAWALQIVIATHGLSNAGSIEFHNLRSLKLQTWLSGDCICGITSLLNISPNIVKLSLEVIADTTMPILPHWDEGFVKYLMFLQDTTMPILPHWDEGMILRNPAKIGGDHLKCPLQCMHNHLKIVEIRGLQGRINELKFLEVLLKNAMVLEKLIMVFDFDPQNSPSNREKQLIEYSKILQLLPRASSSVTFVFI